MRIRKGEKRNQISWGGESEAHITFFRCHFGFLLEFQIEFRSCFSTRWAFISFFLSVSCPITRLKDRNNDTGSWDLSHVIFSSFSSRSIMRGDGRERRRSSGMLGPEDSNWNRDVRMRSDLRTSFPLPLFFVMIGLRRMRVPLDSGNLKLITST